MKSIEAIDVNGNDASSLPSSADANEENGKAADLIAAHLTTDRIFQLVIRRLSNMGYHCSSVEKSEDFTGRIDGVLNRRIGPADLELSGYSRILTVYRVGGTIHVELYNFVEKFPTDNEEMDEVKQALNKMFRKNHLVKVEIHE